MGPVSAAPAAQSPTCPAARRSRSARLRSGVRVLDLDNYVPHLLGAVNNPLSAGASALYLDRFGVGVVEWRVLSTLMIEPGIAAARIGRVIAGDKAAVSRALKRLAASEHVCFTADARDTRRKKWALTEAGRGLHDRIIALALAREERLIEGIDPDDLEVFLTVIRRMRANVAGMTPRGGAG